MRALVTVMLGLALMYAWMPWRRDYWPVDPGSAASVLLALMLGLLVGFAVAMSVRRVWR